MRNLGTGLSASWPQSVLPRVSLAAVLSLLVLVLTVACGSSDSVVPATVEVPDDLSPAGTPVLATAGFLTDREDRSELSRLGTLLPPVTRAADVAGVMPQFPDETPTVGPPTAVAPPVVAIAGHTPAHRGRPVGPPALDLTDIAFKVGLTALWAANAVSSCGRSSKS